VLVLLFLGIHSCLASPYFHFDQPDLTAKMLMTFGIGLHVNWLALHAKILQAHAQNSISIVGQVHVSVLYLWYTVAWYTLFIPIRATACIG